MNEELKAELQAIIDRDYELAEKQVVEMKKKHNIKVDLNDKFCFFVCWDLQRQFGLDLKGVIPE